MTKVPGQTVKYAGANPWPILTRSNGDRYTPPEGCFYLAYRGSVSHGTYVPPSDPDSIDDIDLMGFVIAPPECYLGISQWGSKGTQEVKSGTYDVVLYEIRKAVSLLLNGNPNIMSMLWVEGQDVLLDTEASRTLVANRDLFSGKHIYDAFAGYAYAQMQKMESRDPAELREYLAVTAELKGRGIHPNDKGTIIMVKNRDTGESRDVAYWSDEKLLARMAHFHKKGQNIGYMGEKRKGLVLEHGYDSKNAAHLIRLLRMCCEFLETGEMKVRRPDYQEILDIKKGKWALTDIKSLAEELFAKAKALRDSSSLPPGPNREKVELMLMEILARNLSKSHVGYMMV